MPPFLASPAGRRPLASVAWGAAILSGLLLLASEPGRFSLPWLAWLALVPLLVTISGRPPRQAGLLGLVFGMVYFLGLLSWVVIVLSRYGHLPLVLALTALLLLAFYMSLYPALVCALASRAENRFPLLWSVPLLWVGLDWVRSWLFSGFPWQDLGYSQYRTPWLNQIADLAGHHGITLLILLANGLLAALFGRRRLRPFPGRGHCLAACLLIGLAMTYNLLRYQAVTDAMAGQPAMTVTLVQASIPQERKWLPAFQESTVRKYLTLSRRAQAAKPAELLIWPETALPFYPLGHPFWPAVRHFAASQRLCLLTGAPHRQPANNGTKSRYYNSAFLLSPQGRLIGRYDKQHLVPFGEYIPFRSLLPYLAPVVESMGDFDSGTSSLPLTCQQARIGVLICFEAIFPDLARRTVANGATLLANLTNDAWFGSSAAPWQHLSMAVLRAVENRRSLARAANSGISALVDPAGRLVRTSRLFASTFCTASLPLATSRTLFQRGGFLFGPACGTLALLLLVLAAARGPRPGYARRGK